MIVPSVREDKFIHFYIIGFCFVLYIRQYIRRCLIRGKPRNKNLFFLVEPGLCGQIPASRHTKKIHSKKMGNEEMYQMSI